LRTLLAVASVALGAGCAMVPPVQQAFAIARDGSVAGRSLQCGAEAARVVDREAQPLPGPHIRVLSWNLQKGEQAGWEADLARFAAGADVVLLQEALLTAELQRVLRDAGHDWLLAGSFNLNGQETGVLSAARVRPASACAQRSFEPLLQLPKSALIARYKISGSEEALAVANVHSINFTLGFGEYRDQLEGIARELAGHRGPVIFAGDFNTWNPARLEVLADVMQGLGLAPALPLADTRTRFLGHPVDFVFVRGLDVVHAVAPDVTSSDHNPVLATLRLGQP
jgi:endonuclease/exonuclease/phosphatase (EEP) superfamily protein YafD